MIHDEKIQELKDSLLEMNENIQLIQAKADGEKRDLLEDEKTELDNLFAKFKLTEEEIERRTAIIEQTNKLHEGIGRSSEPQIPAPQNEERRQKSTQGYREPRIQIVEDRGKWGWKTFGEFAASVRFASHKGGHVDPRLVMNAPTTYSSEGIGTDGGFAVPPDFRATIMEKVMAEDTLLGRTDQMTTTGNSITFPKDETTPWDSSGGLQAYWDGEGDQLTQSKLALKDHTVRLNKLTALVPVTEELLQDAPSLDSYLRRKVPEKFNHKIDLAIVQGTGAGQPTGILTSPSLVSVAEGSGQAPDTVIYENIVNMYSRLYAPVRNSAVWLIHQDVEAQLNQMAFPVGSSGTSVPVYLPPGGLSAAPYGTLMGRPIVPTQACNTVGDKGDIILVALSQYLTATKSSGIRADTSIHLFFDYDVMTFRFIFRVGGEPWWNSAITPRDGSNTLSWAVSLDTRT